MNSITSLKRKREDDEDVDLYGESESTGTKSRGIDKDDVTGAELNSAQDMEDTGPAATEEMEWLMFLVTEQGELQVLIMTVEYTNVRSDT